MTRLKELRTQSRFRLSWPDTWALPKDRSLCGTLISISESSATVEWDDHISNGIKIYGKRENIGLNTVVDADPSCLNTAPPTHNPQPENTHGLGTARRLTSVADLPPIENLPRLSDRPSSPVAPSGPRQPGALTGWPPTSVVPPAE